MQEWKSRNSKQFVRRLLVGTLILAAIGGISLILINNKSKKSLRELNEFTVRKRRIKV